MKKNIVIGVLIAIILIMGGALIYFNVRVDNEKAIAPSKESGSTEKEEQVQKLDVSSSEVTSLYSMIDIYNNAWYSDNYYGFLYRQNSIKTQDISNDVIVFTAIESYLKECGTSCTTDKGDGTSVTTVPASKVSEKIKNIFGNVNYQNVSTRAHHICGDNGFTYSNDTYTSTQGGCGMIGFERGKYIGTKIVKAEKSGNEINVYVNVIFAVPNFGDNDCVSWDEVECLKNISLYKDFNKTALIDTTTENIFDGQGIMLNSVVEKYSDKLDTYKFTFVNESSQYHFKSVERV